MIEQVFGTASSASDGRCGRTASTPDGFDSAALLDELRCHTSEWLLEYRAEAVAQQRRAHVRELAATAVLDERGRIDSFAGTDGVSVRSVRETVETARRLEELSEMAAAAYAGRISEQQLAPAARLADPSTDGAWTEKAANTSPADLQRAARKLPAPSAQEMAARRERRQFRWWHKKDDDRIVAVYGEFLDVDGVVVETVLEQLITRMRPAKGQSWDTRDHRGADAFVELCTKYADVHAVEWPQPLFVLHHTPGEPVTIAGIPLPDSLVEALLPNAKVELVVEDIHGSPVTVGGPRPVLARRIRRSILRRDGMCRYPGCERRTLLQVHHLWPVSWGGTDDLANLVSVCAGHHARLAPHGQHLLLGNPNRPDGLRLVHVDELPRLAEPANHRIRARPDTG